MTLEPSFVSNYTKRNTVEYLWDTPSVGAWTKVPCVCKHLVKPSPWLNDAITLLVVFSLSDLVHPKMYCNSWSGFCVCVCVFYKHISFLSNIFSSFTFCATFVPPQFSCPMINDCGFGFCSGVAIELSDFKTLVHSLAVPLCGLKNRNEHSILLFYVINHQL